jgi:hypothetical protein
MELEDLKVHLDQRLDNLENMDRLKHERIDERLVDHGKDIDRNEEAVKRVHDRVDTINTQIKTVQGVGTAIATALGGAAAWIGLTGK